MSCPKGYRHANRHPGTLWWRRVHESNALRRLENQLNPGTLRDVRRWFASGRSASDIAASLLRNHAAVIGMLRRLDLLGPKKACPQRRNRRSRKVA